MNTAGLLTLRTNYSEGRLVDLDLALNRPAVPRLFLGKTPTMVVEAVPLLYTVCSRAQHAAARAALGAADGRTTLPASDENLWMEMLHESLWRVLLDWPPALGLPAAKDAFVAWRSARNGGNAVSVTEALCSGLVLDLSAKCLERIPIPEGSSTYEPVQLCPKAWLEFCLAKTGHMPNLRPPVSIRSAYMARIAQLQEATRALASKASYPVASASASARGWGVGQVATARGVLTHAAQVVDGRIAAYRVWAPTDVFFSDSSALLALLGRGTYTSPQEFKSALGLAVLALDPCVPFQVELIDA
jgi:hypothetical protein